MHSEHSDKLQNTDITILQLISEFGAMQGLLRMSPALSQNAATQICQWNSICSGSHKLILISGESRVSVSNACTILFSTILGSGRKSMSKGVLKFCLEEEICSNHVFNTIPCLRFVPPLRCVEKNNNLALCRYSLDTGSIRYIISS